MESFDLNSIQVHFVRTSEDAIRFLSWLGEGHNLIGLDVETGGLSFMTDRLRLVQFGSLDQGWAIPFERFPGLVVEALELLDRLNTPLVGHNILFDLHFIEFYTGWSPSKTSWARIHNTLLLAAVIDSTGPKGLKDLSVRKISPVAAVGQAVLHEDMKRGGWGWATVPVDLESYWVYGCLDTILTVHLFWRLREEAKANGSWSAYELEREASPVIFSMERRGMLVDSDYCNDQIDIIYTKNTVIEQEVFQTYGVENIRSNNQIIRALLDDGVELRSKTDKGNWTLDKDALEELVARTHHPLASVIHEHRHGTKMVGSYYENFLKFQMPDGRVHPQYRQAHARTGRMSCTAPAMQTLPRAGTDTLVRNSFVAAEGHQFVSTDFANVEARIFAHFAQEQGMLQAIRDGVDLHCYTAKEIYQLPEMPSKESAQRQTAKNVLFCRLFGGGVEKVAWTAGVSVEVAAEALEGFKTAFPSIKDFQNQMSRLAKANYEDYGKAFIQLPDGRIVSLREGEDKFYVFTNYLIQGYAASLMKKRLAVIDSMGLTEYLVGVVHDEVIAEVPIDLVEDYLRLINEAMNDDFSIDVPIVAESGKPADRLGECK